MFVQVGYLEEVYMRYVMHLAFETEMEKPAFLRMQLWQSLVLDQH